MSYLTYQGKMVDSQGKFVISSPQPVAEGVIYFNTGSSGIITFVSQPDVTGNKTLTSKFYLDSSTSRLTFGFMNALNDFLFVSYDIAANTGVNPMLTVNTKNSPPGVIRPYYDISSYLGMIVEMEVVKTSSSVVSLKLNGNTLTKAGDGYFNNGGTSLKTISGLSGSSVWDVTINGIAAWVGYPSGDQNLAWEDTIGSNDGTVSGSVSTRNLF